MKTKRQSYANLHRLYNCFELLQLSRLMYSRFRIKFAILFYQVYKQAKLTSLRTYLKKPKPKGLKAITFLKVFKNS